MGANNSTFANEAKKSPTSPAPTSDSSAPFVSLAGQVDPPPPLTKKNSSEDHYEPLPEMRTPLRSPPKSVMEQATSQAGTMWGRVVGWLSPSSSSTNVAASPAPPPPSAPVQEGPATKSPPLNIRAPEDQLTKVKWNQENYKTLSIIPNPEGIFPDRTPPGTPPAKGTPPLKAPRAKSPPTPPKGGSSQASSLKYL